MHDTTDRLPKEALEAGFRVGDYLVEPMLQRVTGGGEPVQLEPRVMEVLVRLAEQPGRPVSKDEFLDDLWDGVVVTDDALMRCIGELRRTLGDRAQSPRYIETIRKRGYRLIAPVTLARVAFDPQKRSDEPGGAPAEVIVPEVVEARMLPAVRPVPRTETRRRRAAVAAGIAALALVGIGALGVWLLRPSAPAVPPPLPTTPLTTYPGEERDPRLSPDGTALAFVWDGGDGGATDLYVKQIGITTPLRLTDTPANEASPAWSPDGQRLAFVRGGGVFSVPATGGTERHLVDLGRRSVRSVDWSPDGRLLALSAETEPGGPFGLWLVPLGSLEPRRLTAPPPDVRGDLDVAFSPDSRSVAFVRGTTEHVGDVFVVPIADSTAVRRLTTDHADVSGLAWTRDGARVVFASDRGGESALWAIAAGGGEPTWVHTAGDSGASQPTLARRATRLAFVQRAEETNLWHVPLDSAAAAPERALIASTRRDSSPALSPDGRVAFVSTRGGATEVWVARADGSGPYPVTRFGGPFVTTPRWSPDGRHIAFVATVDGSADVYVVDPAGGQPLQITTAASNEEAPAWSRDGRWLYFASTRTGRWEVWKRRADASGAPVQVTRGGGFAAQESPDGRTLYTTRVGAPGLWQQPIAGGPAALAIPGLQPSDWGNWAATSRGVFHVRRAGGAALHLWNPATGADERIAALVRFPKHPALAVSADGLRVLAARLDRSNSDILLVDGFDGAR